VSDGTAAGEARGGAPTGRLFRSLRADGDAASGAVPALSLDQAVGLKTVTLGDKEFGAAAPVPILEPVPIVTPSPAEDTFLDDPVADAAVAVAGTTYVGGRRGAHAAPGIRASGVWLVVIGVTVLVAFADVTVVGAVNWITGVALLAASIYGALMVRRDDWPIAVIAPPLAMFLAVITAGQLTLGPISDFLVNETLMILITLGNNVLSVFGATVVAFVIVLVRRSRWS